MRGNIAKTANQPLGRCVAVLGAESTGKTTLTQTLHATLCAQGIRCICVPEYLREWCDVHQRTPQVHEQLGIAQTQSQRIEHARLHADIVLADTTALMTAIYSEFIFNDHSLYPYALSQHQHYQVHLLLEPDLPWVADGLQRDGVHVRAPVHTLLLQTLHHHELSYQLIQGWGTIRTRHALEVLRQVLHPLLQEIDTP